MHPILFHAGPVTIPAYGVATAFGILGALLLAMRTAWQQGLNPNAVWNSSIQALFYGAVAAKLWMLAAHFRVLRSAPILLLNLAALGTGEQALAAGLAACAVLAVADDLGCLMAGCAYGTPAPPGAWSLTYHSAYAFVWWGTPVGAPLRPVPVVSAVVDVLLALLVLWVGSWGLRRGRVAAVALAGAGVAHFLLQFWRGDVFPLPADLTPVQAGCLLALAASAVLLWQPARWRLDATAGSTAEAVS